MAAKFQQPRRFVNNPKYLAVSKLSPSHALPDGVPSNGMGILGLSKSLVSRETIRRA